MAALTCVQAMNIKAVILDMVFIWHSLAGYYYSIHDYSMLFCEYLRCGSNRSQHWAVMLAAMALAAMTSRIDGS